MQEWLSAAGIIEGPVFRGVGRGDRLNPEQLTAQSVALIVKHYADAAGLDVDKLSGHSLRAGFITSAADNRASISRIMEVSRHRDPRSVETYVRRADRYSDHAGDGFL
ncbi:DNA recombinase [Mesorhizobium soli]|uniref:DNA recombinase n=1 Tax=Pseudaminobacter soli (ex Li et al. 2025) TaxID=1295366 RepID=A0A2P7RUC5_9HYPH|nr:DNA recombinase [Mesorhizobium soli]